MLPGRVSSRPRVLCSLPGKIPGKKSKHAKNDFYWLRTGIISYWYHTYHTVNDLLALRFYCTYTYDIYIPYIIQYRSTTIQQCCYNLFAFRTTTATTAACLQTPPGGAPPCGRCRTPAAVAEAAPHTAPSRCPGGQLFGTKSGNKTTARRGTCSLPRRP